MKKILLAFFLICSITGRAQSSGEWTNEDIKLFGSREESLTQERIQRSYGQFRGIFIGYKAFYLSNLSFYIQSQLDYKFIDEKTLPTSTNLYSQKEAVIQAHQLTN